MEIIVFLGCVMQWPMQSSLGKREQRVHRCGGRTAHDVLKGRREAGGPGVQKIRKDIAGDGLVGGQQPDRAEPCGSHGRCWKGSGLISFALAKGGYCSVENSACKEAIEIQVTGDNSLGDGNRDGQKWTDSRNMEEIKSTGLRGQLDTWDGREQRGQRTSGF